MIVATIPRKAERLMNYLRASGGSESTTFIDDDNKPDLFAARRFAERLRETHKDYVDKLITITQSYNRVTISVIP